MATVAQLIEYLKTLPPNATVDVLTAVSRGYATHTQFVPLVLDPYHEDSNSYYNNYNNTLSLGDD